VERSGTVVVVVIEGFTELQQTITITTTTTNTMTAGTEAKANDEKTI